MSLKCVCNAANTGQWIVTAVFKIMALFPAQPFFSHGSDDQNWFLVVESFSFSFYFKIVPISSFLNLGGGGEDLLRM